MGHTRELFATTMQTTINPPPTRTPTHARERWWRAGSVRLDTKFVVVIAPGKRPATFRTWKLSPVTPMVLRSTGRGRVGHRHNTTTQKQHAPHPPSQPGDQGGGHPHTHTHQHAHPEHTPTRTHPYAQSTHAHARTRTRAVTQGTPSTTTPTPTPHAHTPRAHAPARTTRARARGVVDPPLR